MGTHSLSRNSLTTDAISYLVVSHLPLYDFKFKGHDSVLHIIMCCITMCRSLANFSLKNYGSNARKYARGNTHWESVLIAHCPSRCFMPHCIVVLSLYSEWIYTRPKFGSFSKTSKSRLSLGLRIGWDIMKLTPILQLALVKAYSCNVYYAIVHPNISILDSFVINFIISILKSIK